METWLSECRGPTSGRTFVVVCCQRFALHRGLPSMETATPIADRPLTLSPLVKEVLLAPCKRHVDVLLAQPSAEARAWIIDATAGPREIRHAYLEPGDDVRTAHLPPGAARAWAIDGGLHRTSDLSPADGVSWPVHDVPPGLTPEYFNVARREQQFARFAGDEIVTLDTPLGKSWSRLPGGEMNLWVLDTTPRRLLRMMLDTVLLEPDVAEAIVFWRSAIHRAADAPPPDLRVERSTGATVSLVPSSLPAPPPAPPLAPALAPPPPLPPAPASVPPPTLPASPPLLESSPAPPAAPDPPPAPDSIPVELLAALEAEKEMGAVSFLSSLRSHRLDLASLARHRERHTDATATAAKRGDREPRRRHDRAFFHRMEELRGRPISPRDYAMITVAAERRVAPEILGELGLPPSTLPLLRRIFAERAIASASLRDEMQALVEAERAVDR